MSLNNTATNLADAAKKTSVSLLNARVAEAIDLALTVKQAHWNMRDEQFVSIHEMVNGFRAQLHDHIDAMAERVAELGGVTRGTVQDVAKVSRLCPYPTDINETSDHLVALVSRYGHVAHNVRRSIDEADEGGDTNTAHIFTQISEDLDKALQSLKAHSE